MPDVRRRPQLDRKPSSRKVRQLLNASLRRQPTIAGTGIEARIVAQRHRAGESIAELVKDYRVDLEHIEDAIRCETREAA
jgi:hypothetical protein